MQEDERDLFEVLIFDEIEETVGTWLRAIIRRLEKENGGYSKGSTKAADLKPRNAESNASLPEAPSEVCKLACPTPLDRRRQVLPISARSGFGKLA